MKTCRICGSSKPASEFNRKADNRDGLQTACRECDRAKAKAWQRANKATAYSKQAIWRDENRARWNACMSAVAKRRQAAKLQRVPPWFDAHRAREVYELAAEFREAGIAVDVDHIVPLQGKAASGLHWHGNLRVCLQSTNRSKRDELTPHHGALSHPATR